MTAPELKPCPFCGGDASISKDHDPDGNGAFYAVKCRKCHAKSPEIYAVETCNIHFAHVRDAWNRRADLADANVAAAYEVAADKVDLYNEVWNDANINGDSLKIVAASIRAIATQPQADALQAMIDAAVKEAREKDAAKLGRVMHQKRGSFYRVLGRGKIQTDKPLADYANVVIYQCEEDGGIWVRPVSEFEDGRFAKIGGAS